MNIVAFAKELSHNLHKNQRRNDGKTPYTIHTDYVGDNCLKYLSSKSDRIRNVTQAVGYLHDSIEDQTCERDLLKVGEYYGIDWIEVVEEVVILSRVSKEMPIIEYLDKIYQSSIAKAVKLADLEHNMSDLGPGNLRDKYHLCQSYLLRQ